MAVFAHTTRRAVLRALPPAILMASTATAAPSSSAVYDAVAKHRSALASCEAMSQPLPGDQAEIDAAAEFEFACWIQLLTAHACSCDDHRARATYLLERIAGGGELNSDDVGVLLRAMAD